MYTDLRILVKFSFSVFLQNSQTCFLQKLSWEFSQSSTSDCKIGREAVYSANVSSYIFQGVAPIEFSEIFDMRALQLLNIHRTLRWMFNTPHREISRKLSHVNREFSDVFVWKLCLDFPEDSGCSMSREFSHLIFHDVRSKDHERLDEQLVGDRTMQHLILQTTFEHAFGRTASWKILRDYVVEYTP